MKSMPSSTRRKCCCDALNFVRVVAFHLCSWMSDYVISDTVDLIQVGSVRLNSLFHLSKDLEMLCKKQHVDNFTNHSRSCFQNSENNVNFIRRLFNAQVHVYDF